MARQTVESRVESLERRVTTLEQLPVRIGRLESQILQFREEVRGEFSAVRADMRAGDAALREEIRAGDEETRRVLREEIREGHVIIVTALTEQIQEVRRHAQVLFEETISRIAAIQEGIRPRRRKND